MEESDGTTRYIITCKDEKTDLIYDGRLFHSEEAAKRTVGDWEIFQKTTRWRVQAVRLEFVSEQQETNNREG